VILAFGTHGTNAHGAERAMDSHANEAPASASAIAIDAGAPSARTAPSSAPTRSIPVTRIECIERAGDELLGIVRHAHRGELQQHELRAARIGVERRLARSLAAMPADLRPSDRAKFDRAVARLNQIIIRSQEWEAFGARPRPEWGWDPQREIVALQSDDAVLEAGEVIVADVR